MVSSIFSEGLYMVDTKKGLVPSIMVVHGARFDEDGNMVEEFHNFMMDNTHLNDYENEFYLVQRPKKPKLGGFKKNV